MQRAVDKELWYHFWDGQTRLIQVIVSHNFQRLFAE